MMRRRSAIAGAGAVLLAPGRAWPQVPGLPPEVPEDIPRFVNPPDKIRLLRLTDRPPNYATPTDVFTDAITPNDRFFVSYHSDAVPVVQPIDDWRLALGGDAALREARLSWGDLADLPQIEVLAVCQSAGNRRGLVFPPVAGVQWPDGAMGCAAWRGPRLSDVLKAARVGPEAVEIWFDGADTPSLPGSPPFRKSLPVAKAMDDDTMIAVAMNGAPLPLLNGYPARLVVPGWAGAYWMKHLDSIQISKAPLANFWMTTADRVPTGLFPVAVAFRSQTTVTTVPVTELVVNSIIADPVEGGEAERSGFTIRGVAWDRGTGIRRVEVSLDDGRTWQDALLDRPLGPYAFRRFSVYTGSMHRGEYRLMSRATNNDGERQPEVVKTNPGGYYNNAPCGIAIRVT